MWTNFTVTILNCRDKQLKCYNIMQLCIRKKVLVLIMPTYHTLCF